MNLLRRFLAPLFALCFALAPAPVGALPPARTAAILSGVQGWSFPGSSVDLYFARNGGSCTVNRLLKPCASLLTTARASTGYAQWADGHLSNFAANTPRITDLGLLVEQAATNLQLRSQQFTVSPWAPGNGGGGAAAPTVTDNQAAAPDGTTTAALVQFAVRTAAQYQYVNAPAALSTGTYTGSIYVKAADAPSVGSKIDIWQFDGAVKNLATVTLTTSWQRLATTGVSSMNATGSNEADTFGRAASAGGGSTGAVNIYVSGGQIETGSFATSYIPTTTVAVTRAADVISLTGAASTAALAAKAAYVQSNLVAGGTLPRLLHYSGGAFMDYASGTTTLISNGTNTATATMGSGSYTGLAHNSYGMGPSSITAISNNGTKATSANAWAANTGTVYVGSNNGSNALNGYMPRLVFGAAFSQFDGVSQ